MDKQAGLQWTQSDNGKDINQAQSIKYCEQLNLQGGKWRLPSEDELLEPYVFSEDDDQRVPCGGRANMCFASKLFHLTANYFWSATSESPTNAFSWSLTMARATAIALRGIPAARAAIAR